MGNEGARQLDELDSEEIDNLLATAQDDEEPIISGYASSNDKFSTIFFDDVSRMIFDKAKR